jgi:omega-amidase
VTAFQSLDGFFFFLEGGSLHANGIFALHVASDVKVQFGAAILGPSKARCCFIATNEINIRHRTFHNAAKHGFVLRIEAILLLYQCYYRIYRTHTRRQGASRVCQNKSLVDQTTAAPAKPHVPCPLFTPTFRLYCIIKTLQVKLALCQLFVTDDKQRNIQEARRAVAEAVASGAQLIVLPEMWNCPYSNDSFPIYAEDISSGYAPSYSFLSDAAKQHRVVIVGGSIPERADGRLYNTCFVFGRSGRMLGFHRKTHLFDIDIPGKITFKESDTLTQGQRPTIVNTEVGTLGIGICYDIRFPELAAVYASRGAHILIYPGAFNMTTGPVHWELLQRARAVDNQLFVATCSPARDERGSYVAWGHSTAVGPFGEILGTRDHTPGTVLADLDLGEIEVRRTNMPIQQQRRDDLYALLDITRDVK